MLECSGLIAIISLGIDRSLHLSKKQFHNLGEFILAVLNSTIIYYLF